MKKIGFIKYTLLIAAFFSLYSCSEEFLELYPTEDVATASATETTGNLFLIINGIHRSLYIRYGAQGRVGQGALMLQNDFLGDDLVHTTRGNGWFVATAGWQSHTDATNADLLFPYRTYYRIVRNANTVIVDGQDAVGPEEEKNAAIGQALVYRAWAHFQMVQLYGERYDASGNNSQPGIPIRLQPDNEPLPRSSVEEVYAQVHEDLDLAIQLLDGYERGNKSHLDQSVAQGLKARVALVQGDWDTAAQFASTARENYTLMSNDDYFNNFSDYTNQEWMWGTYVQEDQSDVFGNFGAYISRNFSSVNIRTNPKAINSALYDEISSSDIRAQLFDPTGKHENFPPGVSIPSTFSRHPYTSQKFIAAGNGDSRMDVPYMRAAEMYLIEAEALSHINEDEAKEVLFELASNRDPEYTLSSNSGEDLLEEILIQRRIELWGEGFRFYDLKRLNRPLDRTGTNHDSSLLSDVMTIPAGDPRWQFLIPQRALDANPLLEQNSQ